MHVQIYTHRHTHMQEMEQYHVQESDKLKSQLHKRYDINTKLSIQVCNNFLCITYVL